mgnify:CR=1 FL=1
MFYFFLFKDFPGILHVLPCFPFVKNKITRAEFEPIDFQELAKGREAHINNFMHDMMGLPYQFDVVAMSQDPKAFLEIAKRFLGNDNRLNLIPTDGGKWVEENNQEKFDYIFADTWHGKYLLLDEVLSMLNKGGLYIIDDMLPQPNWPDGHQEKAIKIMDEYQNEK